MDDNAFLNARRLQARIGVHATALLLGLADHDVLPLVKAKLLKPLGNPAPNAPKYFATCEILRLANDAQWLDKATRIVSQHWQRENGQRPKRSGQLIAANCL
jgi:hypothetical protein